jgi:hypothetical protein
VILFVKVIQIFKLKHFNKTDSSCQHQQEVNVFQTRIVGTNFYL